MPFVFKKNQFIFSSSIILLLFVTPFITSGELYNGTIVAKELWFFGVVALILLYFAIKLIVKSEELIVKLNLPDILLLTFYVWCFINAIFVTPYTPFYYNHKLQLLTGCMVVYFFVKLIIKNEGNKNENSFIVSLLIFLLIFSGLLQAVYGLLQLYGVCASNHGLFKVTGSFFNPAPYALYLAVVFPVALGGYLFSERAKSEEVKSEEKSCEKENSEKVKKLNMKSKFVSFFASLFNSLTHSLVNFITHSLLKYLSLITVIAILLILPATMIRAAWLGAIGGSLVVLQFKYNYIGIIGQWLNSKTRIIIVCLATLVVLAATGLGLYNLKEGSSVGKTFIWEVTLGKIFEKALLGHGVGRFEAEYNNWQAEYFQKHPAEMNGQKGLAAGNTKYAFNEFIEMTSETGIVGTGLFIAVLITLTISSLKKLRNGKNEQIKFTNNKSFIPSFSSFLSLIILLFISFPLYSLPTLLLLFILMGMFSAATLPVTISIKREMPYILRYPITALRIAFACIIIFYAHRQYDGYYYWVEAQDLYFTASYPEACVSFEEAYNKLPYNGLLMQSYGKSLAMCTDYKKGIDMLERAQHFTSDEVLYTAMGDCLKALQQYRQAERAYQCAAYMVPHKLYPHYLLAKLYAQSGNAEKAIKKANEVLGKNAKVESMAEEEIKNELKQLTDSIIIGKKGKQELENAKLTTPTRPGHSTLNKERR